MTLVDLANTLDYLTEQSPTAVFLMDVTAKASVISIIALVAQWLSRDRSASSFSLYWLVIMMSFLLLPFFSLYLPNVVVSLATIQSADAVSTSANLSFGSLITSPAALTSIIALYFFCSVGMLLYLLVGLYKVFALTRKAKPCNNDTVNRLLADLKSSAGENSEISILVSSHINSPLTLGLFRHIILIPDSFLSWDKELLQQILSHELNHIQRRDWLYQILSRITLCIHCFNPLVWLIYDKLLLETEKACDDAALDSVGSHTDYAEGLVKVARAINQKASTHNNISPSAFATAMYTQGSSLRKRIQHILQNHKNRQFTELCGIAPTLFVAAMALAPFSALTLEIDVLDTPPDQEKMPNVRVIPVSFISKGSKEYEYYVNNN